MATCTAPVTGAHISVEAQAKCPVCSGGRTPTSGRSAALPETLAMPQSHGASFEQRLSRAESSREQDMLDVVDDRDDAVRAALAANPDATPLVLEELAQVEMERLEAFREGRTVTTYEPAAERLVAVQTPVTAPTDTLMDVARHPNANAQTLNALARVKSWAVRENVAGNRCAPAEVLELLANDKEPGVRSRVAQNPSVPGRVLKALLSDGDDYTRRAAERNVHRYVTDGLGIAESNWEAIDFFKSRDWWEFSKGSPEVEAILAVHPNVGAD